MLVGVIGDVNQFYLIEQRKQGHNRIMFEISFGISNETVAINVLNDYIAHSPTISCSCKTTSVALSSIGFTWSELIVLNRTRSPGELGSLSTNHCNDSIKESCKLSGVMQILTIHEMGGYYTAIIIGIHLYPD